eukprot:1538688-Rhodomonas_salina.2
MSGTAVSRMVLLPAMLCPVLTCGVCVCHVWYRPLAYVADIWRMALPVGGRGAGVFAHAERKPGQSTPPKIKDTTARRATRCPVLSWRTGIPGLSLFRRQLQQELHRRSEGTENPYDAMDVLRDVQCCHVQFATRCPVPT